MLCASLSTTSADFFFLSLFFNVLYFGAPFNTRLRGNTESSVVDTGVSLSTHTSQLAALLWGGSFPIGPGSGKKGSAVGEHGVMMSQQEIKTQIVVGEMSKRANELEGRDKCMTHVHYASW